MDSNNIWLTLKDLVPFFKLSERAILYRASKGQWRSHSRPGSAHEIEYCLADMPEEIITAYLLSRPPEQFVPLSAEAAAIATESQAAKEKHEEARKELLDWAERQTDKKQKKGKLLAQIAISVAVLTDNGKGKKEAIEEVVKAKKAAGSRISKGSVWRIMSKVEGWQRCDWWIALIPHHCGGQKKAEYSPEAWNYWCGDYLRPEKPAAAEVYRRLQRAAKEHGWTIPSVHTLVRETKRVFSYREIVLAREGREKLDRTKLAQKRDPRVFHAMQALTADGHRFDVNCRFADGTTGRPLGLVIKDIYSGKMVGYYLGKNETSEAYRLAFRNTFSEYGIPDVVYLDNSRAAASKKLTGGTPNRYRGRSLEDEPDGILTSSGIKVVWTTPYHGQSKPIERDFKNFCERISKHPEFSGAYTGSSPEKKPSNYGTRYIPFDDFVRVFETELKAYNEQPNRQTLSCRGRSFNETFEESYKKSFIRKATPDQIRDLTLTSVLAFANRENGSITINKNTYWTDKLADSNIVGKHVIVRFDPQNMHGNIRVHRLDGSFWCEAECNQPVGFNDASAAEEVGRQKARLRKTTREGLDAKRRIDELEAAKFLPGPKPEPHIEAPMVKAVFRTGTYANETAGEDGDNYQRDMVLLRFTDSLKKKRLEEHPLCDLAID